MKVEFKHSFLKSIERLKDSRLKGDILAVILNAENASALSEIKNIKKLKGYTTYYRIRIGDFRIGLKWEETQKSLYFVTFGHRKEIYNIFP